MRPRTLLTVVAACGAAAGTAVVIGATVPSPSPASSPSITSSPSTTSSPAVRAPASPAPGYQRGNVSEHSDVYPYAVYVPPSLRADSAAPLVVVLHGCATTADQMAAASQYDALAERDRFIVLYPDVDALDADTYGRCWRGIWAPDLEGRGVGDAGAIADMTRTVIRRWHADPGRVYAIGISAGGFETAILAAYYPDLYAAIGIHSGAPYMGAEPGCLPAGANTAELAGGALDAMGPRARVMPVVVIHGDADPAVPYLCGQQAIAQWLRVDNLVLRREHHPGVPGSPAGSRNAVVPGGHGYTVLSYADGSGCVVGQLWTIHGMGHYWSGGSADPASARYSDPRGPSAAAASWAFFSRWGLSGPLRPCTRAG
jgi:poly(hydroxyalkanoate) depolymerase family esterase